MFKLAKQGAVSVISGEIPLNKDSADQLTNIVRGCFSAMQPRVVIDLAEVPLADSIGLETLLDLHEEVQQHGGQLRLAAPTALLEDALDIAEISGEIEVCSNTSIAVGRFSK